MQDAQVNKKAGIITQISNLYFELCENGGDKDMFLDKLRTIVANDPTQCYGDSCYQYIAEDPDCKRGEDHIKFLLVAKTLLGKYFESKLEKFFGNLKNVYKLVQDITVHLDGDVRDGIEQTKTFLEDMKVIAEEWIQSELVKILGAGVKHVNFHYETISLLMSDYDRSRLPEFYDMFAEMKDIVKKLIIKTPWASNRNVTEMISAVVDRHHVISMVEEQEKIVLELIRKINGDYEECELRFANYTDLPVFNLCIVYAAKKAYVGKYFLVLAPDKAEDYVDNAFNAFPEIQFGYIWYFAFFNSGSLAARFGNPGLTLAHELSHSIIKSTNSDIITYFSNEATNCIQSQYNATCAEFDEGGCEIAKYQFDENGADVLGMEILNTLFERHFLNRGKRAQETENIKDLQQMFYSISSALCTGERIVQIPDGRDPHAAHNIRINALANHPAFQKAFQCPEDSRMMRSRTVCYFHNGI
uniref:Peptidase_M13 domain-containing protein n=1 Tax=Caenorhabditis tropicalis TaxID=1561998 RepID=A0A1I7SYK3_9PELO